MHEGGRPSVAAEARGDVAALAHEHMEYIVAPAVQRFEVAQPLRDYHI